MADTQVPALSASEEEIRLCALRLGYRDEASGTAGERLLRDHRSHTAAVNGVFTSVFSGDRLERADAVVRKRRRRR